ncbi:MAG: hypothetical protein MR679_03765 [Bacteroidales bacterium]|nr:hypothetical protein [Bacteroidales bacterium]
MKKLLRHTLCLAIVLLTTAGLASCEDEHDLWMRDNIVGTWKIYDVRSYDYNVPYRTGDFMEFFYDGTYRGYGRNGFDEYGDWDVTDNIISFDFNHDYYTDMEARVDDIGYSYMYLDVKDYDKGSHYYLRLRRY